MKMYFCKLDNLFIKNYLTGLRILLFKTKIETKNPAMSEVSVKKLFAIFFTALSGKYDIL